MNALMRVVSGARLVMLSQTVACDASDTMRKDPNPPLCTLSDLFVCPSFFLPLIVLKWLGSWVLQQGGMCREHSRREAKIGSFRCGATIGAKRGDGALRHKSRPVWGENAMAETVGRERAWQVEC